MKMSEFYKYSDQRQGRYLRNANTSYRWYVVILSTTRLCWLVDQGTVDMCLAAWGAEEIDYRTNGELLPSGD